MDGKALTATELARVSAVNPSTASEHLAILVQSGMVAVRASGRHRYYILSGGQAAAALEALALICPPTATKSLRQSQEAETMRFARTCYDHLAGILGVALLESMSRQAWIQSVGHTYRLTPTGARALRRFGIDIAEVARQRRKFAYACLDWTQRKPHLGGALGAAVTKEILDRGWLRRLLRGRGLRLTPDGEVELRHTFHLRLPPDA
jgi:DNA-binding transcriptional ArsR family regulator